MNAALLLDLFRALKARNVSPLQGEDLVGCVIQGRCPWLLYVTPLA
jgi:hypothetical protein